MKTLITLCLLLPFNAFAYSEIKDFYGYVGLGIGKTWLKTSVDTDKGKKDGSVLKYNIFGTYYHKSWMASLGLGFYDLSLENELTGTDYVKLITESFYMEIAPEYRLNHRFSVGLSYQHMIGEDYLAAPSTTLNANNEKTSASLAGLVFHYDIPFKAFRIRTGLSAHKVLSIGARDAFVAALTLKFGTPLYDSDYNEEPKVIYKYRDREVIKTIPAETIELGEQVINFRSGSYRLNEKSSIFIEKMAKLLSENLESWEIVRIVGHTDIVGPEESNQILSERRAESVKNVFINYGLSRERIFYLGFGESKLKTEGTSKEEHRMNRRVELQFIGHLDKGFADQFKELVEKEKGLSLE